jgi:hypothetical protein
VYHYAGNNPVRYVDPDGRLQRDDNGGLIFETTGEIAKGYYKTPEGEIKQTTLLWGCLFAGDGTRIRAAMNVDRENPWADTDCHGLTFADGRYWINDDQVNAIIRGDGYKSNLLPQAGDVVVYYNGWQRNGEPNVVHSAKILCFVPRPSMIMIEENAGDSIDITRSRFEGGIYKYNRDYNHYTFFRGRNQ